MGLVVVVVVIGVAGRTKGSKAVPRLTYGDDGAPEHHYAVTMGGRSPCALSTVIKKTSSFDKVTKIPRTQSKNGGGNY